MQERLRHHEHNLLEAFGLEEDDLIRLVRDVVASMLAHTTTENRPSKAAEKLAPVGVELISSVLRLGFRGPGERIRAALARLLLENQHGIAYLFSCGRCDRAQVVRADVRVAADTECSGCHGEVAPAPLLRSSRS